VMPIQYIGGLSRLNACSEAKEPINLLIILSGPEPQRTIFENLLLSAVKQQPGKTVLVRGLPGEPNTVQEENDVIVYNHAPAALLNQLICSSQLVISRSGYTTVMDLLKLGKKSILVPTPGQAEQEYLATHLYNEQLAYTVPQAHFSLSNAMTAARAFPYKQPVLPMEEYKNVIRTIIEQLNRETLSRE